SSDVISTAASAYIATIPHATAPGCHVPVKGTRTLNTLKLTNESSTIAVTCTAVNTTARPPRNRCTSSSQFGRGRLPRTFVLSASPQSTLTASSTHATIPAERVAYHSTLSFTTGPPSSRARCG